MISVTAQLHASNAAESSMSREKLKRYVIMSACPFAIHFEFVWSRSVLFNNCLPAGNGFHLPASFSLLIKKRRNREKRFVPLHCGQLNLSERALQVRFPMVISLMRGNVAETRENPNHKISFLPPRKRTMCVRAPLWGCRCAITTAACSSRVSAARRTSSLR